MKCELFSSTVPMPRDGVAEPVWVSVVSLSDTTAEFARAWNAALADSEYPHIHQSYEWAQLFSQVGWVPQFFCIKINGQVVAGAVLLVKTFLRQILRVATIRSGPFWLVGFQHVLALLYAELERWCRTHRIWLCRVAAPCPDNLRTSFRALLPVGAYERAHAWSYWAPSRPVMTLDLRGTPEDVLKRMHPDTRTKVRRGPRRGIVIRQGTPRDLDAFLRLLDAMKRRKHVLVPPRDFLDMLLRVIPQERVGLLIAEAAGHTVGGALVVSLGKRAWYLYGAYDHAARHLYPMESLYLAMTEWARARGCDQLDLGGTCTNWPPDPRDKGYGVYDFKRRFGAQSQLRVPYYDLAPHPLFHWASRAVEDVLLPLVVEEWHAKLPVICRRLSSTATPLRKGCATVRDS
jgi:lipid II:glycine glycyltransferase (peptidoglycan interpeptide bridge formation enzyme)